MKSTNDGITLLDHGISKVPGVAINATSNKGVTYLLDNQNTSMKGPLLGIIKPSWTKVAESESRLAWLKTMWERGLCVRNIEAYAKSISDQLRTDEMKVREEERSVLLDLMLVKIRDEKRNLRILLGIREEIRNWLRVELGKRKFETIMRRLGKIVTSLKERLKHKYKNKVEHLAQQREIEKREKESLKREIPEELSIIKECLVYNKENYESLEIKRNDDLRIGKVDMSAEESALLSLNPKFAVLKCLDDEEQEHDIELGLTKLRYEVRQIDLEQRKEEIEFENANGDMTEIKYNLERDTQDMTRQVYHPFEKSFDYGNRRVTDLPECSEVILPKPVDQRLESEMSMIREIIMKEFVEYKKEIEKKIEKNWRDKNKMEKCKEKMKRNQEYMNLTRIEKEGLHSIKKRMKAGEIVVVKTDKSSKLVLMKKDEYIKIGAEDCKGDKLLSRT